MIFFETAGQARTFLLLTYAGFGAGLLYDLLRLPRRFLPRFCSPALDALWCLLTGAAVALALALGGEHRARLYVLLGLALGAAVYWLGVRAAVRGVAGLFGRRKVNQSK